MQHYIPENHPLRQFFAGSIQDAFYSQLGICAPDLVNYLTDLLVEFVHVRNIYPLKSVSGEPLTVVSEMVSKAHLGEDVPAEQRDCLIHRHVGDYTMYWSGMYPESIEQQCGRERVIDFFDQGKRSYAIAAELQKNDDLSTTLVRLSEHFEDCAQGLNLARETWT